KANVAASGASLGGTPTPTSSGHSLRRQGTGRGTSSTDSRAAAIHANTFSQPRAAHLRPNEHGPRPGSGQLSIAGIRGRNPNAARLAERRATSVAPGEGTGVTFVAAVAVVALALVEWAMPRPARP